MLSSPDAATLDSREVGPPDLVAPASSLADLTGRKQGMRAIARSAEGDGGAMEGGGQEPPLSVLPATVVLT